MYKHYNIDINEQLIDSRSSYLFPGGEDEALARLKYFLAHHLKYFSKSK